MRISDWSSDVCSSDLATLRVDIDQGVRATRHAYRGLWREFQIEARLADRRDAAAGKSICRIEECLQAERPCSIRRVRKINLDAQLRCHRSEEHTSELQSLMRISYAFFCFKKKKKQTKS